MKKLDKLTKRLLLKEAALSSMNIGVGLTFLRKHNFAQIGFVYQSFFSLSIGIERLLKLILLHEYLYVHNKRPERNYLKSKGHNIVNLFSEVQQFASKYSAQKHFSELANHDICTSILSNLSDFATANRYFHLDTLSGGTSTDDPLVRWEKEVNVPLIDKHYKMTKDHAVMLQNANAYLDITVIRHSKEDDKEIDNYHDFMANSILVETKQKYSTYYTFLIVKAICELQVNQSYKSQFDIFLHEFFSTYRITPKQALTRKSWNPYHPYKF
jgi:hypothetical protein